MPTQPTMSAPKTLRDLLGYYAYVFAVSGGRPDPDLLTWPFRSPVGAIERPDSAMARPPKAAGPASQQP